MQLNPVSDRPIDFFAVLSGGLQVFSVWSVFCIVWFCTDGHKGENKYGLGPKAE
ncbi:MAG: hypothetical protein LUC96_11270 [Alistipes sp.]|uniref:hypothetical protein n=1 Tax=Alistipes sp. TaxID=1872444 RepID=UPI0025BF2959|nr:hypothetical protein [Alistipes sp.]MCD8275539.1 hypothetical protein [Alistipes sp.]